MLRPAEGARHFELRRLPATGAAAQFVEWYWSVSWQQPEGQTYTSEVLPYPCVNVTVESGDGPRHGHRLPDGFVHGVVTRRFTVDLNGTGAAFGVKFRTGGFAACFGVNPRPDTVTPLAQMLGPDGHRLVDDVLRLPDDDTRAAVVDGFLDARAPEPDPAYLRLLAVHEVMETEREVTRVEQVADRFSMSTRSLQRLFGRFVGVGPKLVLRRYRLQDAAAALDSGAVSDLSTLAAELGWFDQAHFTRDFREVVGVTPSEYLALARQSADRRSSAGRRPAGSRR